MSNVGNILLDKEILLESGTNELEVLVFTVADYTFGINVAKVREVLQLQPITNLPRAHHSVRGVFKLRDLVVPCVSLYEHLQLGEIETNGESTMILTDFNRQQTAFLVDGVERIHRLSWKQILAVPSLMSLNNIPVTAVARVDDRLIVLLDFEMIIDQVTGALLDAREIENPNNIPRHELKIVLADDSPTVRKGVSKTLEASGYTQLRFFENGGDAWQWLESQARGTDRAHDIADLIISDIEMPQVDGFHLTKKLKQHPVLGCLPVLLYSSIVTPDNDKKGQAVGADAQIAKPELHRIVDLADELISSTRPDLQSIATKKTDAESDVAESKTVKTEVALESPNVVSSKAATTSPKTTKASKAGTQPTASILDPELWDSFRNELHDHLPILQQLLETSGDEAPEEASIQELARRLHTIKAAAMVVPIEPIVRATHLAESLLEVVGTSHGGSPWELLIRYMNWLQSMDEATPRGIDRVLDEAPALEIDLAEAALSAAR